MYAGRGIYARHHSDSDSDDADDKYQEELNKLRSLIEQERKRTNGDSDNPDVWWEDHRNVSPLEAAQAPKHVRTLKGHFGKVYAVHWAGDSRHLVSASQDGKLIIWNGCSTNKIQAIPLRSTWVMTCAFETMRDELVACGGLDNMCSIYRRGSDGGMAFGFAERKLAYHEGYISCCRFTGLERIITASGDESCVLWDIESRTQILEYKEHDGDVISVCVTNENPHIFASGSTDTTARVWDMRSGECTMVFDTHESDVNSVSFFPTGSTIGTGSDDSYCRLFDLRSCRELSSYSSENIVSGITSTDFSGSGRMLFAGYDDYTCYGWDVLSPPGSKPIRIAKHENRVSCLQVNPVKNAVVTGSWDTLLKIHA